jgi:DNA polymerase-3 subunit beta
MKFSISSHELLKAITTVSGAVPSKSTLPILECMLFEKEGQNLKISATDLEISIIQMLEAQFETNGTDAPQRIAVPAKRLLETLRALPDLPITFHSNEEYLIELKTDQGKYKMAGYDGSDYPHIQTMNGSYEIVLDAMVLKRSFQKTGFAVSKDALRPAMMGVFFRIETDHGEVVATDGHRLIQLKVEALKGTEPTSFIVPEKALNLAGKIAVEEDCTISVQDGFIGFAFTNTTVMARVIDEKYPNYGAVIPQDNNKQLLINRAALLAAVKRVGLYSSSTTHQIRLSLRLNELIVSAEDIERSSEAQEKILCEYGDDDLEIGFNSVYLTEILNNVDTNDVHINFSTPNRAGIITPSEQNEGEKMLMLIMPVMLNTYA